MQDVDTGFKIRSKACLYDEQILFFPGKKEFKELDNIHLQRVTKISQFFTF